MTVRKIGYDREGPSQLGAPRGALSAGLRMRFGSSLEAHATRLNREMFALLGGKLQPKGGKTWIATFDRGQFSGSRDTLRFEKVGAGYFGNEHNMYGDPKEVRNVVVVVGRGDPDRYSCYSGAESYGVIATSRMMSLSDD